jgi:hypothetical protein
MSIRLTALALLLAVLLPACSGGASDLTVVSKTLRRDNNSNMAGGMGDVPSSGAIFWVEGKVKNSGTTDIKAVTVAFRVTDGRSTLVLSAVIPTVAAGQTVDFRTPVQGSVTELRLVEEEPGITVGS